MSMSHRCLISAAALAAAIAGVSTSLTPVAAQAPAMAATFTPPKSSYVPPKTPWGDPDIQGVYDYQSVIPMQRPAELAGKATFTESELAEWTKGHMPNQDACGYGTRANEKCTEAALKSVGAYNEFWNNRNIVKNNNTSLIVDPPDGRMPAMTPEGTKKRADLGGLVRQGPDGPEASTYAWADDWPTVSRCIAEQTPNGVQMYNSGTYLQQTPGWVLIVRERLDTRTIPIDGRPHLSKNIQQWNGDSRGHWEGNTLVVETTNLTDKQFKGGVGSTIPGGVPMGNIHLIEHFVPTSPTRIDYYATITDNKTWVRPWTFMLPWEKDPTYTLYEYACNEGNISIGNGLRGERAQGR